MALLKESGTGVSGTVDLASYLYCGVGRLAETHTKPTTEVALSRFSSSTPSSYTSLDRFGRVVTQAWKTSSGTVDEFDYNHDLASNRISRASPLTSGQDQVYGYVGCGDLTGYAEGTLSGGTISSPSTERTLTCDALGNWASYNDYSGGSLTQTVSASFNAANEITYASYSGGTANPTHDAAGNMTKAADYYGTTTYIWDAWDRLKEIDQSSSPNWKFDYDGLGRKITTAPVSGGTSLVIHYYLSEADQVLEEKNVLSGTTSVANEYVWHPYYVDAMALRYNNMISTPALYYATHDANYNITSMVDSSGSAQRALPLQPIRRDKLHGR